MSKRQEKIQANIKRQQDFIAARRQQQLVMLEQAYQIGLKLYEENKDKLSAEEIEQIEFIPIHIFQRDQRNGWGSINLSIVSNTFGTQFQLSYVRKGAKAPRMRIEGTSASNLQDPEKPRSANTQKTLSCTRS